MRAKPVTPQKDFNSFIEKESGYHTWDRYNYIESDHVAEITETQADFLEEAAQEIYRMCLSAVDKVIREKRFAEFGIGPVQARHITNSWQRNPGWPDGSSRDPELYGRIDFWWDGKKELKFYEINADTPTTAYECAVVQWTVVKDLIDRGELPKDTSQFNTLEEKTTDRLKHVFNMASKKISNKLHFTSMTDWKEDLTTTSYLEELARKAGWKTHFVDIGLIGANEDRKSEHFGSLYDENNKKIDVLYKLMPWEHMYESDYAKHAARDEVLFLEPPWKALLSNKMLSVILWEMYPYHPYLLPTYTSPEPLNGSYVEKPIFGRISASVKIVDDYKVIAEKKTDPDEPPLNYERYPKIYQKYQPLPEMPGMPGWRYQTGVWIVGNGDVGGMDLRIDKELITGSPAIKFLPHVMIPHRQKPSPSPFKI